jgi:hypothetical protein
VRELLEWIVTHPATEAPLDSAVSAAVDAAS